jgi:hypothetical protein
MARHAFGIGNLLGMASLGVPLDVFHLNPEIPDPPSQPVEEPQSDSDNFEPSDRPQAEGWFFDSIN